jgi:hypothetical protein
MRYIQVNTPQHGHRVMIERCDVSKGGLSSNSRSWRRADTVPHGASCSPHAIMESQPANGRFHDTRSFDGSVLPVHNE